MPLDIPRFTISRIDDAYQAFPDVARTASGRLIAVWRASMAHTARGFSDIVLMHSDDDGATWENRRVLASGPVVEDPDRDARPEGWWSYNCPRITALRDGRLVIICDRLPRQGEDAGGDREATNWLWFSDDDGATWSEPLATSVPGIVPDRIVVLSDGTWITGTHWRVEGHCPRIAQFLWRSPDQGRTWFGPHTVADVPGLQLCEASFLELPSGTLVAMMRENSAEGIPALKCFSEDGGVRWSHPRPTLLFGCHRPVMGLLESGETLVTYRFYPGHGMSRSFAACLMSVESLLAEETRDQSGRILALDHDRNQAVDTGYSGWVQLPDGRVLVVYYIKDDAPVGQIRGCWLRRESFVLG